jgi:hypothetical protein
MLDSSKHLVFVVFLGMYETSVHPDRHTPHGSSPKSPRSQIFGIHKVDLL